MDMESTVYDDEITEEADGSFTLDLSPWCEERLTGIPTKKLARAIACVAHEAMDRYADAVMM